MDFYVDDDELMIEMTPDERIDYVRETFLDYLAEGIMKNYINPDSLDVEVIDE